MWVNPASQNFIIPIFPSSKLLLKKSGREVIRITRLTNVLKEICIWYNRVLVELLSKLLQFWFLFVNPRKLLYSLNFLLNLDRSNIKGKGEFHRKALVLSNFWKYTIQLYCIWREKTAKQQEKGEKHKANFHSTWIVLVHHRWSRKINHFPWWV